MKNKTIIKCPNCEVEGMEIKEVFSKYKPKVISIEDSYKEVMSKYDTLASSSGDISIIAYFNGTVKPLQVVYSCKNCGYTIVCGITLSINEEKKQ